MNTITAEMGIIPILTAVFGNEFPEGSGPEEEIAKGETERGTITRPISRKLWNFLNASERRIIDLVNDYNQLHNEGKMHSIQDCEAFRARISRMEQVRDLIHKLLWQSITEEHKQAGANENVCIRKGWLLVNSESDEWKETILFPDETNIANNLIARIGEIIQGKNLKVSEEDLIPVGEDEEVIDSLDDEKIRAFWVLISDVKSGLTQYLPSGVLEVKDEDIRGMTVDNVELMCQRIEHFISLSKTVSELFWFSVRDSVNGASKPKNIGIRNGWKVVDCGTVKIIRATLSLGRVVRI